jgi:IS30 family transposase
MAVERKSGFLIATYRHTLTYDKGREFFGFRQVDEALQVKSYFCHPGFPGERALNEQSNGLLRQFFPRRSDFSR